MKALDNTTVANTPQVKTAAIDPKLVEVDDPNLYSYKGLLTKFTPKSLLEKYETTIKKAKVKIIRSLTEKGEHKCTVKFHTQERSLESIAIHPKETMRATYEACQKMIKLLFPKIGYWLQVVHHVDSLQPLEASLKALTLFNLYFRYRNAYLLQRQQNQTWVC